MNNDQTQLVSLLDKNYTHFKENSLKNRFFKHDDISLLIKDISSKDQDLSVSLLGKSVEHRDIYQLRWGKGKTKVLLWSQMHGDEPTATMAFFDVFNFLMTKDDEFDSFRKRLKKKISFYFIPMVNPDGVERYQRRNALGIDLNRDFLTQTSPEAKILRQEATNIQADFAFNMHDQNRFYAVGDSPYSTIMAFLAPAYDLEGNINATRKKAIQLIDVIVEAIEPFIPNRIATYADDFGLRCFGDNIQKMGTSTLLFEGGYAKKDPEKQHIRKLHFIALLTAFDAIANESYQKYDTTIYHALPKNKRLFFDIVLRNIQIRTQDGTISTDLALNQNNSKEWEVAELGDLREFFGHSDKNANDLFIHQEDLDKLQIGQCCKARIYHEENHKIVFTNGAWCS